MTNSQDMTQVLLHCREGEARAAHRPGDALVPRLLHRPSPVAYHIDRPQRVHLLALPGKLKRRCRIFTS